MSKSTRRDFLKGSAAVTAGTLGFPYIVSSRAMGSDGNVAPSNRIVMGAIGVGGQGTGIMRAHMGQPEVQMVAVCDVETESNKYYGGGTCGREPARRLVEKHYAEKTGNDYKGCVAYRDFRELLARKDIDAVTVCTPDHWHGLISVAAANAGKDIYCEKPLVNTVAEGRAVCDAVSRSKRILQCGSHERSNDSARYGCELVLNGRIGKVHTVRINLPMGQAHHKQVMSVKDNPPGQPVPEGLDWDFWLGPTPAAPYSELRHPFWWRFILTYGGGEMTDRGAHVIDLAQLGLGTDDTGPVEFKAQGEQNTESIYDSFMKFEFECRYANDVRMVGQSDGPRGVKFEGSDGWLFINVHGGKLEASSPSLLEEKIGEDEIQLGRAKGGHVRNFLDAVRSRGTPFATAEIGHRTASLCHLLNIAMRTGKTLQWNPVAERITNDTAANALCKPPMRGPWSLGA